MEKINNTNKEFYHGSPFLNKILQPQLARGQGDFQNQTAIYLTDIFGHAAIYAIGKTLKGKTHFAITPDTIYIAGEEFVPDVGYVYSVIPKTFVVGEKHQFFTKNPLIPMKVTKVYPGNYSKNIKYFKDKIEFKEFISTNEHLF